MNLQLRKFKPEKMADDKVCVFIGKRNTGKSTLVTDILYHKKHLPAGIVLSATEEGNHYYQQYIPELFIYGDYDREAIERVMDRQKRLVGAGKRNCGAFLLLDDCMYDSKFMKDTCIRQCFMNGRHWKIMTTITMQYPLGVPPNLRTNIDYTFILREPYITNRKRIYENYAGMFPTFESFCQVMDQCTENYECLVMNNNAKSNKLQDQIFWYKAETHPDFKLGSREFWNISKDLASDDEDEVYDPAGARKKSAGQKISVRKSRW